MRLPALIGGNASRRRMDGVLAQWLDRAETDLGVGPLPDEQAPALRDQQMSASQQRELGDLLERQREGRLDDMTRRRLDALMAVYRRGMVRKAQALRHWPAGIRHETHGGCLLASGA